MTARLRYIAYLTEKPDMLAEFYRDQFGFTEQARSPAGDISLIDGAVKLALFRARDDLGEARIEIGLHHVGFAVDSIAQVKARFRRFAPRGVLVPESGKHRGEVRLYDPEFHPVSLSEKAFDLTGTDGRASRLTALAFGALDPEVMADFYVQVLGLQPVAGGTAGAEERPDRAVSDGAVTLTFGDVFAERAGGHKPRYGLARCGFKPVASSRGELRDPDGNSIILAKPEVAGGELWRA